ncbi:substrate-binding domain-containing protein [Nonomuraea antimicrobica]
MSVGRLLRITLATCLALLCTAAPAPGAAARVRAALAGPAVNGSGSTFAAPAIDQWRVDAGAKLGLAVNYNANGSTSGRNQFEQKLVDFASSDVSYRFPDNLANEPTPSFPFTYMPLVAGGTAMLYNLKDNAGRRIEDLQLTGELIMKIYHQYWKSNGNLFWDDPMIKAENPHLEFRLPNTRVSVVARKGGSGTTAVFTGYLRTMAPQLWHEYLSNTGQNCYGARPACPPATGRRSGAASCAPTRPGSRTSWPRRTARSATPSTRTRCSATSRWPGSRTRRATTCCPPRATRPSR